MPCLVRDANGKTIDPLWMKEQCWPSTGIVQWDGVERYQDFKGQWHRVVQLYDKQIETVYSVERNIETFVVACNKVGKDFIAGLICPDLFLRCVKTKQTCRIVTTSVAEHHLTVLWGEIGRFLSTSRIPILAKDGGPLVVNHMEIRRKEEMESKNPLNYLVGRVSAKGEGLAGHHADVTLGFGDEATGLSNSVREMFQGWAKRLFWVSNPNPVPAGHFFYEAVKSGDILAN
jgi:hypothetical protein